MPNGVGRGCSLWPFEKRADESGGFRITVNFDFDRGFKRFTVLSRLSRINTSIWYCSLRVFFGNSRTQSFAYSKSRIQNVCVCAVHAWQHSRAAVRRTGELYASNTLKTKPCNGSGTVQHSVENIREKRSNTFGGIGFPSWRSLSSHDTSIFNACINEMFLFVRFV